MISNPTSKGKTSEAVILAALVKLGKHVLVPWGEERYDLAIDEDGSLVRIQCKTGHIRDGCICFKTSITDARRPLGDGGYAGQIDAFAVYRPQIERVWLVPIEDLPTKQVASLRIRPPASGQKVWIRGAIGMRCAATALHQTGAEDEIRTRDPRLGKAMRYRCATSA